ncbi:unnamed protein product [Ceutorhynchus assimilis]|uniref:Rho-GAP domain-containing protein n=1 Tax=Ceutorhynchus assimilis TaxID=467358 RepID=A0A9P0DH02_9CUCU|nr:unnamed protein product [Ceutorhynchus assimilis]
MVNVQAGSSTIQVPKVFRILIDVVKTNMKTEGLFRVEGRKTKEKAIVETLDKGDNMPDDVDAIEAASVIKKFLRNISGNLIPTDISQWFYEAGKVAPTKIDEALQLCVLLLPLRNLHLMVYLMEFFNEVTKQSGSNKMTSQNMAVVVAPNIFPEFKSNDLQVQLEMSNLTLTITKSLIEHQRDLPTVLAALTNKLETLNEEVTSKSFYKCWS